MGTQTEARALRMTTERTIILMGPRRADISASGGLPRVERDPVSS
jgi:hypothetical protein